MQKALTQKQKVVLATIKDLSKKLDKSPTLDEIRKALNYSGISSVQRHVDALKAKGYIINEKFQNRSLEFSTGKINIPLVGNVACGMPLYAEENIEAYVPYSNPNIKVEDHFFLRAIGDSMNDTNIKGKTINDGDFVLVKQTNAADLGDRVVALIGEEATIKRLRKEDGYLKLVPESINKANKPLILMEEPLIQGKVIDVLKKGNKTRGI